MTRPEWRNKPRVKTKESEGTRRQLLVPLHSCY